MVAIASIVFAFLALGLQATLVPHIAIAGVRPDLAVVATVFLGLARGAFAGTIAGFAIGLAQDLTNPAFLGLNALTKSLLGHASGALRTQLNTGSLPMHALVLFAAVLAHDLVYLTIFTHLALSDLLTRFATQSLPTAVYTALVGMWAFPALGAFAGRGGRGLGRTSLARR